MTHEKFNQIICQRILTLRKKNNLTMEQLAYQSGVSKGGLSEIERNLKEPRAYTIFKLCNGLGISIKDFFNFEEINNLMDEL